MPQEATGGLHPLWDSDGGDFDGGSAGIPWPLVGSLLGERVEVALLA